VNSAASPDELPRVAPRSGNAERDAQRADAAASVDPNGNGASATMAHRSVEDIRLVRVTLAASLVDSAR